MLKKILCGIGCAIFTWSALAIVLFVDPARPIGECGVAILATILLCMAILFAGIGMSEKDEKGNLENR